MVLPLDYCYSVKVDGELLVFIKDNFSVSGSILDHDCRDGFPMVL